MAISTGVKPKEPNPEALPAPWTQAEEDQLTALIQRKQLVQSHHFNQVLNLVEEFHHRDMDAPDLTRDLISVAPRLIKALLPYATELKLGPKQELLWQELLDHLECGRGLRARELAVRLRDLSRAGL